MRGEQRPSVGGNGRFTQEVVVTNKGEAGRESDFLPCTVLTHCRSVPASMTYRRHPVTIHPDWSVETGHDLEIEKIAAALGGYSSCLLMAEATVPAAQHWLRLQLRQTLPALSTAAGMVWRPRQQSQCCPAGGFRDPGKAAEHVRSDAHTATVFGAPRAQLAVVLRQWSDRLQSTSAAHRSVTWKVGLNPGLVGQLKELMGRPLPRGRRTLAMIATHLQNGDLRDGIPRGIAALVLWCRTPEELRLLAGDGSGRVGDLCRSLLSWYQAGMALSLDEFLLLLSPGGFLTPAPTDRDLRKADHYETVRSLSRTRAAVLFTRLGSWAAAEQALTRAQDRHGASLDELRWVQWAIEIAA